MSKQRATRKPKQQPWLLAAIGVIAVAVIAFIAIQGSSAPPQAAESTGGLISPQNYQTQFSEPGADHFLIDVRTPEEYESGYIAGAANISLQTLADRLSEVPTDQPIVVYCRSGNRSAQATQLLNQAGYTEVYDLGGVIDWTAAGFTLQQ